MFFKIATLENLLFIDISFFVFLVFVSFVRCDISLITTPLILNLCYIEERVGCFFHLPFLPSFFFLFFIFFLLTFSLSLLPSLSLSAFFFIIFKSFSLWLFYLIFYLWSITDLQCCIRVSCIAKWVSYIYTSILFQIIFLCKFITEYWVEFPVLYS